VLLFRGNRDYLLELARTPLLAVVLLSLVTYRNRPDLVPHALVAPVLMALWGTGLLAAGEMIHADREQGILEPLVATPAPLPALLLSRVVATTALGGLAVAEVWLVALGMGRPVPVPHPMVLLGALLVTAIAMVGASLLMATLFVVSRTALPFQNSLTYPVLVLSGVFVPAGSLPGWLEPLSRLVFLSWSADLLRDSLRPEAVPDPLARLGVVLALGAAGLVAGHLLLHRVLRRVRVEGSLGLL
jgi:ABC-2 type transport system permease protein